jgi:hypothetical protein
MFTPINQNDTALYQQVLKTIRLRMNGITSQQMHDAGLHYKMNYGVSIVDLRLLAGQFGSNQKVALMLWNQGWRETYILATLMASPTETDSAVVDKLLAEIPNSEISEQLGNNLLSRLNAHLLLEKISDAPNNLALGALLKAFARKYMLGETDLADQLLNLMKQFVTFDTTERQFLAQCIGQAFAYLLRKHPEYKAEIDKLISIFMAGSGDFNRSKQLVQTEMNWLNDSNMQ